MAKREVVARFGSRIVGTGMVEAGQLLGNERNWRVHPMVQQEQLGVVLAEIGFVQSVIVNRRSGPDWGKDQGVETLVDGHLRAQLALSRGEDTLVPVTYVDLSPAEERAILATFDPLAMLAGEDKDKLGPLVEEVGADFLDTELDLAAIFGSEKTSAKGLSHEVHECTCCQKKCKPGCGCYREEKQSTRKKKRINGS